MLAPRIQTAKAANAYLNISEKVYLLCKASSSDGYSSTLFQIFGVGGVWDMIDLFIYSFIARRQRVGEGKGKGVLREEGRGGGEGREEGGGEGGRRGREEMDIGYIVSGLFSLFHQEISRN
jgi:hypothetical protein